VNYYLGIDIGTTSAKAVAFSHKGEVIESHSISYDMHHPLPGYSEQDPEEIFEAVIQGLNKVLEKLAPSLPEFISFSAAMHSIIVLDQHKNTLTPCIIWADNRSEKIAQHLRKTPQGQQFYQASGVPIHSMSPLCKLLWLREHQPRIFTSAYKFIGIKEYVFYKLFNEFAIDTSLASATGLLNGKTLAWDKEILDYVGIAPTQLSTVVPTKQTFYYKNYFPGFSISSAIPFVIGASDGALSNLGSGAVAKNAMAITIGTSGAARMVVAEQKTDSQMRTFCYHLKDNLFVAGGANNNGAVVLQWLKENLLQTNEDYDALFAQAATIAPGSNGLIFLPYLLGERAPIWNGHATGVYFGLTIRHTRGHVVRAALEGVIFSMFSIATILVEQHHVTELHASGGFAKSALWLQILADVSNIQVLVSDTVESSALGAVMLGAEALGIPADFKKSLLSTYEPNPENHEVYKVQFKKFERLYELLKGEML
jgi:gluconokinase